MRLQLGVGAILLVGIAAACAKGAEDAGNTDEGTVVPIVDASADTPHANDGPPISPVIDSGSTPLTCTTPCTAGLKCSGGACVPDTTDADKDGYDVQTDCDDNDATIHPGATETCNDKDDNCDGVVDEGFDADKDTYFACAHGTIAADCDDTNANVHPNATEVCNDVDDNCDGVIDDGFDVDGDTYFVCAHGATLADCDDTNPAIHPGAAEICDGKDDDCNGKIDDLAAHIPATGTDTFQPTVNSHWVAAGNASINIVLPGWALLTNDANNQAGALWWNASYLFDHFDASFTFEIDAKSGGADGIAFAWVPGMTMNVGGGGGGFGYSGLGGFAVAVDTYKNDNEPTAPFLSVIDTNKNALTRSSISAVQDGKNHILRVVLQSPNVSAWVDGVQYISSFAIPNYAPFSGHWGISAGTGSNSERHIATGITMTFPDGQGCVP